MIFYIWRVGLCDEWLSFQFLSPIVVCKFRRIWVGNVILHKVFRMIKGYYSQQTHSFYVKGAETILYTYKYWPFSDMFDNCFSSHGLPILTIVKSSNSQKFVSNFVFLSLAYKYENLVTVTQWPITGLTLIERGFWIMLESGGHLLDHPKTLW